jgi:hypothetical protein
MGGKMKHKGHTIQGGVVEGEALVTKMSFSFLGDFDIMTGQVNTHHELAGEYLGGKILVFPSGRGSTTGALVGYYAKMFNTAPAGMICSIAEPVIVLNALSNKIPMIDKPDFDLLNTIKTGDFIRLDATNGEVELIRSSRNS